MVYDEIFICFVEHMHAASRNGLAMNNILRMEGDSAVLKEAAPLMVVVEEAPSLVVVVEEALSFVIMSLTKLDGMAVLVGISVGHVPLMKATEGLLQLSS